MTGLTFRGISEFSGINPGVNTAIQLIFLVPFSYVCITLIKKIYLQKLTKSANVCLHLLPPISDHVIVNLRGNSCAIFTHR